MHVINGGQHSFRRSPPDIDLTGKLQLGPDRSCARTRVLKAGYCRSPLMNVRAPPKPDRLFEYFAIVGAGSDPSPADDAPEHGLRALRAVIEDRLPRKDSSDSVLPEMLPLFCFPHGVPLRTALARPTTKPPPAIAHLFVLTAANGATLYAAAAVFEDPVPQNLLHSALMAASSDPPESESETVVWARAIVVMSRWPFIALLSDISRILAGCRNQRTSLPLERVCCGLLVNVPLPPPGLVAVSFDVCGSRFNAARPPPNKLPLADVSFAEVLVKLGLALMDVFVCCLTEQKMLFVAQTSSPLTTCMEALRALLFPFEWQHVYIPLLPPAMFAMLDAPMPFMVGIVGTGGAAGTAAAPDVVIVDCDTGTIALPADQPPPHLPERARAKLRSVLQKQVASARSRLGHDQVDVAALRAGFLRFMVAILRSYRQFIVVPQPTTRGRAVQPASFDTASWIASHDEEERKFVKQLSNTQAFSVFVDSRLVPPNDEMAAFERALFDESIAAKSNRSRLKLGKVPTPFLDDTSLLHSTVFHAPPPTRIEEEVAFAELPHLRPAFLLPLPQPNSLLPKVATHLAALHKYTGMSQFTKPKDRIRESMLAERTAEFLAYEKQQHDEMEHRKLAQQQAVQQAKLVKACIVAQKHLRGKYCREKFLYTLRAIRVTQLLWRYRRIWRATRQVQVWWRYRHTRRVLIKLQAYIRRFVARKAYRKALHAVLVVQSLVRRWLAKRRLLVLLVSVYAQERTAVCVLWQDTRQLFAHRIAWTKQHADPTVANIRAARAEKKRLVAIPPAIVKVARKTQRMERRLLEATMKQHMTEDVLNQAFASWNVPIKASYRKRKLLKALFADPARIWEAVRFLTPVFAHLSE